MENKAVKKEIRRLHALLNKAEVPKQKQAVLESVIENLAWMRAKLDEARQQMQEEGITCEYQNGGGQSGTRENPLFKGYVNLWRAYMIGLEKYTSFLPKDMQEIAQEEGQNVLDQVKQMRRCK